MHLWPDTTLLFFPPYLSVYHIFINCQSLLFVTNNNNNIILKVTYGGFLSESRTKKFIIGNKNYDVFHLKPGGEPIICFPAAIALLSLVKKTRTTLESIRTVLGSPGVGKLVQL
mgnify:CR=1 FL=1